MGLKWKKDSVKEYREKASENEKLRAKVKELEQRDAENGIAITDLELQGIETSLAVTDLELALLSLQAGQAQMQEKQG